MMEDLTSPVLKSPEPFLVSALQADWIQQGWDWKEKQLFWMGTETGKVNYRLVDLTLNPMRNVSVFHFISEEEKIICRAFQDWLAATLRKVAEWSRGYFTFDVLQFRAGDEPWSWNDFSALLVAHAKKLEVNERRLIQFGSMWGVLHKRTEADFGRIESKLFPEFIKPLPELFLKKMGRIVEKEEDLSKIFVFRDLSTQPIFESQERIEWPKDLPRLKKAEQGMAQTFYWHSSLKRCLQILF